MESAFLSKEEQAPLTACQKCKERPCIKTGKICDEVEALLPKVRGGGHRKEFATDKIEEVYNYMRGKEVGRRKKPQHWAEE